MIPPPAGDSNSQRSAMGRRQLWLNSPVPARSRMMWPLGPSTKPSSPSLVVPKHLRPSAMLRVEGSLDIGDQCRRKRGRPNLDNDFTPSVRGQTKGRENVAPECSLLWAQYEAWLCWPTAKLSHRRVDIAQCNAAITTLDASHTQVPAEDAKSVRIGVVAKLDCKPCDRGRAHPPHESSARPRRKVHLGAARRRHPAGRPPCRR